MRNILLKIEYDGTNYSGWQFQKNSNSIQETVENALKRITGRKSKLTTCGRTDAGVHAVGHIANFKTTSTISLRNVQRGLNSVLPKDIVIKEAGEAPLKFNSQLDAKSKLYVYTILNRPTPTALSRGYVRYVPYELNLNLMRREAKCLIGRHDFKSFQAADNRKRSSIRTIKRLEIRKKGDLIKIEVEADGFLYKMVRNIAGTLIKIGRDKSKPGSMKKILEAKNRKFAGPTAPAKGLCLVEVKY